MSRAKYERAGRRAELWAVWYLRLKGYRVLTQRFKCHKGEIDIVARKSGTLVFVEVKQRPDLLSAEESLTYTLRQRVSQAADVYVARHRTAQSLGIRFDAIFVIGRWKIHHLKDAWRD